MNIEQCLGKRYYSLTTTKQFLDPGPGRHGIEFRAKIIFGPHFDFFKFIAFMSDKNLVKKFMKIKQKNSNIISIFFRFFARFTKNPRHHEPGLLETIEKNKDGLKGISGERIWMELNRILIGPHNEEVVFTMLNLGLAPHLGNLRIPRTVFVYRNLNVQN